MGYDSTYGTIGFGTAAALVSAAGNRGKILKINNVSGATLYIGDSPTVGTINGYPVYDGSTEEFSNSVAVYAVGTANGTLRYYAEHRSF